MKREHFRKQKKNVEKKTDYNTRLLTLIIIK